MSIKPVVIGCACRLPGARDVNAYWRMLDSGICAVGAPPPGRWSQEGFLHPRLAEPGYSYSFQGGYIDDVFSFDPLVYGVSPREATQMDPQQRLLLDVASEALDDAGILPSSIAGADAGVYVGASSLDYGALFATDLAAVDSQFMTGNTLSIVSNRISYIFDLKGPSFTSTPPARRRSSHLHEARRRDRNRPRRHGDRAAASTFCLSPVLLRRLLPRLDAVADRPLPRRSTPTPTATSAPRAASR